MSIISQNHDLGSINFVAGMSDPGEMIRCGYRPELRRQSNESDADYANRIRPLVMALPAKERDIILTAAIRRLNADTSNGRVAVVSVREVPWHSLGTVLDTSLPRDEMQVHAGQQWMVEQWLLTASQNGETIPVDMRVANVRSDTRAVLGVVGNNYKPFQNGEMWELLDELSKDGSATWETAGSLDGGCKVWVLARMDSFDVVPGDQIKPYALVYNSHDGSTALRVQPTTVRVVCQNTANQALRGADSRKLSIRHSQSMKGRVNEAKDCLGIVGKYNDEFRGQAAAMCRKLMKETEVTEFLQEWYPTRVKPRKDTIPTDGASLLDSILNGQQQRKAIVADLLESHYAETERIARANQRILDQIVENFHNASNVMPGVEGTAWACYNAVSEYVDHGKNYRSDDARLNNVWFTGGNEVKQEVFAAALNLTR